MEKIDTNCNGLDQTSFHQLKVFALLSRQPDRSSHRPTSATARKIIYEACSIQASGFFIGYSNLRLLFAVVAL